MVDTDKMAHDLAIAYVNYKLRLSISESDKVYTEDEVFELYKSAHDEFYELRNG